MTNKSLHVDFRLVVGRAVESPLVYATTGPFHGNFDASLIDGSLAISAVCGDTDAFEHV